MYRMAGKVSENGSEGCLRGVCVCLSAPANPGGLVETPSELPIYITSAKVYVDMRHRGACR